MIIGSVLHRDAAELPAVCTDLGRSRSPALATRPSEPTRLLWVVGVPCRTWRFKWSPQGLGGMCLSKPHCIAARLTTIAPQRLPKPVVVGDPKPKKVKLLHEPPAAAVPAVPDFFQSLQLHSVPVTVRAHGDEYTAVAAVGLLFSNGRRHTEQVAVCVCVCVICNVSFYLTNNASAVRLSGCGGTDPCVEESSCFRSRGWKKPDTISERPRLCYERCA